MALNTSILVATLADKSTPNKMSKFPEKPFAEENTAQCEGNMTEEQIKAERLRAYCFFKTLGRNIKK